jgi:hypothetical protein
MSLRKMIADVVLVLLLFCGFVMAAVMMLDAMADLQERGEIKRAQYIQSIDSATI